MLGWASILFRWNSFQPVIAVVCLLRLLFVLTHRQRTTWKSQSHETSKVSQLAHLSRRNPDQGRHQVNQKHLSPRHVFILLRMNFNRKNKLPFLLWTKNLVTAQKKTYFLTNGTNICSKLDGFPLPSRCFINKRKHLRICGWLHVMVENLWNLLKQRNNFQDFKKSFKRCNLFSGDMPNMVLMLKKHVLLLDWTWQRCVVFF